MVVGDGKKLHRRGSDSVHSLFIDTFPGTDAANCYYMLLVMTITSSLNRSRLKMATENAELLSSGYQSEPGTITATSWSQCLLAHYARSARCD